LQGKIIAVNPDADFSLTQIVSQKLRLNPLSNLMKKQVAFRWNILSM